MTNRERRARREQFHDIGKNWAERVAAEFPTEPLPVIGFLLGQVVGRTQAELVHNGVPMDTTIDLLTHMVRGYVERFDDLAALSFPMGSA